MLINNFLQTTNYRLLTQDEAESLAEIIRNNVQVAFEIEAEMQRGARLDSGIFRSNVRQDMGSNEIYNVKLDGSLSNGLELTIRGQNTNHANQENLFRALKQATTSITRHEGTIHNSCGGHMHILLAHDGVRHSFNNGMVIPKIVMANFYQMIRRFAPELTWITSTSTTGGITRAFGYRGYTTLLNNSPKRYSPRNLFRHQGSRRVYFNLGRAKFDANGDCSVFHVELRFPDGNLSANTLKVLANLFSAILIECVKYSQHGLLSTGTAEHWVRTKELMGLFQEGNRTVFTTDVKRELANRVKFMLKFAKSELERMDGQHSLRLLKALGQKPISFRLGRHNGNWDLLDSEIYSERNAPVTALPQQPERILTSQAI